MSPVFIVIALALAFRIIGAVAVDDLDSWVQAARWATGITFIVMGTAHFTPVGRDVQRLVPPAIPRPGLVVLLLGIWQIAGGIGLITDVTRRVAAAALVVLLLVKLPANVRVARESLRLPGKLATAPAWRIPAQFLWIGLVSWSGS